MSPPTAPLAGVTLASGETVTVARNLGYPSRTTAHLSWVPTTKPLRASKPAHLRTTVTFAYSADNTLPTEDGLNVGGQSFENESSERRHGFLIRLVLVLGQKIKHRVCRLVLSAQALTHSFSSSAS